MLEHTLGVRLLRGRLQYASSGEACPTHSQSWEKTGGTSGVLEPFCKIIEGQLRGLGRSPADEMKTWSRAVSGERAESALNALHPFPSPPCWAPLTLLLRPQAPGGSSRHAGRGGLAGGLGPEGRRVGDQDCGGSEQRRSRWEVARPLGRDRTGPRQGREPGAPWRSQPHSNQGFFPRLAPALPSCLPFPPVNKYLPGSEPRVLVRDGSTSWSIKTALLSPRCAQDMGRSHFSSKKET